MTIEGEDHDHGHGGEDGYDADKGAAAKGDRDKAHDAQEESVAHEHSAFRAEYAFDCQAPASLTTIAFGYFKVFAGAQKLDVTVITAKQRTSSRLSGPSPASTSVA